ncbi:MAG: ABC transporter ATP-binding protein/permease [Coriobacteriaceae bacterium]|nr:ABC transporter ATP-binding protein/permease [Coriobacteriaceae bacterium]
MLVRLLRKMFRTEGFASFAIFSVTAHLSALAVPHLNGFFLDTLGKFSKVEEIVELSVILVAVGVAAALLAYFARISNTKMANRLAFAVLRGSVAPVVMGEYQQAKSKWNTYTAQRLVADSNTVSNFVVSFFPEGVMRVFAAAFVLLYASRISCSLVILVVIAGVVYISVCMYLRDGVVRGAAGKKSADAAFFQAINLIVTRASDIQMGGWASRAFSMVDEKYDMQLDSTVEYQRKTAAASSLDTVLASLFQAGFFLTTAGALLTKEVTIGQFVSISAYFSILLQAITYLYSLYLSYLDAKASSAQLEKCIRLSTIHSGVNEISSIDSIEIDEWSGGQTFGEKRALLGVKKGEIIVFVGPNGAGKSTLIESIAGLIDSEYEITYNLRQITKSNSYLTRKTCMSVLVQDSTPYNCSVSEFLDMVAGVPCAAQNAYLRNCPMPSIGPMLLNKMELNCEQLSGGEYQALRLCVALSKKADVLILDEPTAGLDKKMVEELSDAIKDDKRGRITLVVTHDDSFAKSISNHFVTVHRGKIDISSS